MSTVSLQPQIVELPKIKSSVSIKYAGIDFWHDKTWIMYDKLSSKYYYLGKIEYEIINRWDLGTADKIVDAVNSETIYKISAEYVDSVMKFLLSNHLLQVGREVLQLIEKHKKSFIYSLMSLSKIFFYKVPLLNPDKFLSKTKNLVKFLFSKEFFYFIVLLFVINLFLLAGNWSSFTASIPNITDLSSIALLFITLVFTKVIHELGHAYACRLSGCPVPEMGVTFIFFYPLMYTDVSSSVVLNSKKRLFISTAGLRFELYLAVIAGTLWFFFVENSGIKNLLFFIAAVSWLISVGINISPFIRYDGYFILSDYLKIRNLGARSSAVFKYHFRKRVFGINASMPELYSRNKFRFLFTFAVLSGLYRILLFTSIMLFLYYIEVIGIVLVSIALMGMIFIPLFKEINNLLLLKNKMKSKKNFTVSVAILIALIIVAFIPFKQNIYLPAVYLANIQRVYSPFGAKIDKINMGLDQNVDINEKLLVLSSPALDKDSAINAANIKADKFYVEGAKISEKERREIAEKSSNLAYNKTIEQALTTKFNQLEIKSPINGKVAATYTGIYNDLWLADKVWLFDVVDLKKRYIQAFITGRDKNKLHIADNAELTFIPDLFNYQSCNVKFKSIASQPVDKIPNAPIEDIRFTKNNVMNSYLLMFASDYGGEINFNIDSDGMWVPVDSYFTLSTDYAQNCDYNTDRILKGLLAIPGRNESFAQIIFKKITKAFS